MKLKTASNKTFDKLEHDLRRDIYRGKLLPGAKLHSELQFARKYQISRSSVRQALDSLSAEGLITRVRGSGTFVSKKKLKETISIEAQNLKGRKETIMMIIKSIKVKGRPGKAPHKRRIKKYSK